MGLAILSCDKEKISTENEKAKTEKNDSTQTTPADSTQTTPADSTQTTPADSTQTTPADSTQTTPADSTQTTPADSSAIAYTLSMNVDGPNYVYLSTDTTNLVGFYYRHDIVIDPFILIHSYSSWGFGMGFTYTNCANDSTPGFNNLSAITKSGVKSDTYFIVNTGGASYNLPAEITFKDGKAYNVKECYVTNSTYAYLAIKNQDDGNGEYCMVKKFEEGDWFALTITGYYNDEVTDSKIVVLAQGDDLLDTWEKVDLTNLGKVDKISFSLESTDNDPIWGMNTPSYFCLDQLTITEAE